MQHRFPPNGSAGRPPICDTQGTSSPIVGFDRFARTDLALVFYQCRAEEAEAMGQIANDVRYSSGADEALRSPAPSWATIAQMVETRPDGSWRLTKLGLASEQKLAAHYRQPRSSAVSAN